MRVLTATASHIRTERFGGAIHVYDDNTGNHIGQCDIVRGFAKYYGSQGSAHEGVTVVVRGGIDGLRKALAEGVRNGRDDRQ